MNSSVAKLSFAEIVGLGEKKKGAAKPLATMKPRFACITAQDVPVAWAPVACPAKVAE